MNDDPFERAVQRAEAAAAQDDAMGHAHPAALPCSGARAGFRIHATVFVAVQVLLVAIWALALTEPGDHGPWFVYPLFGWGIGLAAHYAVVRERLRRHD